jgi:hypothetical protein
LVLVALLVSGMEASSPGVLHDGAVAAGTIERALDEGLLDRLTAVH